MGGAELAPLAMREAGLKPLVQKLGYTFTDYGDLDFGKRYEELGLVQQEGDTARERTSQADWRKWMESGSHESFAEWCKKNLRGSKKRDFSGSPPHPSPPASPSDNTKDPYERILNSHLIGPALELIYRNCMDILSKSNQFLLTVGGDHSIATSTIAAVSDTHGYENISVIWIDAHGDANTPEISPSMHYHGMPAAHLLGWFKKQPKGFEWLEKLKY